MSVDPRQNVIPGQQLQIAASQINWVNGQMRPDTGFRSGPLEDYSPGGNVILCRNTTAGTIPRWGVLKITGIEIDPTDGDTYRRSFETMPCVKGGTPTGAGDVFCVAVDPIAADAIGRVAVAGFVQAKVQMQASTHTFAMPQAGNTSLLYSAASGPARILWASAASGTAWAIIRFMDSMRLRVGKTSSAWAKGTTATIPLYENGAAPGLTASGESLTGCVNLWADIDADKWVGLLDGPGGLPFLVVAEC